MLTGIMNSLKERIKKEVWVNILTGQMRQNRFNIEIDIDKGAMRNVCRSIVVKVDLLLDLKG